MLAQRSHQTQKLCVLTRSLPAINKLAHDLQIVRFVVAVAVDANTINSSMSVSEPLNRVFAFAQEVRGPLIALLYFLTDDSDNPCCFIQLSKLFMSFVGARLEANSTIEKMSLGNYSVSPEPRSRRRASKVVK